MHNCADFDFGFYLQAFPFLFQDGEVVLVAPLKKKKKI